jgi:predicted transcriptional regulator
MSQYMELRKQLQALNDVGIKINKIAKQAQIDKSTLSRFMNGEIKEMRDTTKMQVLYALKAIQEEFNNIFEGRG